MTFTKKKRLQLGLLLLLCLQEERQKRMLGNDEQSDEDGEDVDRPSAPQVRPTSGDDLGDSFSFEEEPRNKKGWVDEILARKDEEDSESEDEDSSEESDHAGSDSDEEEPDEDEIGHGKTSSLKDWEQSEDELDLDMDDEEDDEEDDDVCGGARRQMNPNSGKTKSQDVDEAKKKVTNSSEGAKVKVDVKQVCNQGKSLPCLIEAPKNLEELNKLFEGHSNTEILILINRVRACNAIALAAENRKKIQVSNSDIPVVCSVYAAFCQLHDLIELLIFQAGCIRFILLFNSWGLHLLKSC